MLSLPPWIFNQPVIGGAGRPRSRIVKQRYYRPAASVDSPGRSRIISPAVRTRHASDIHRGGNMRSLRLAVCFALVLIAAGSPALAAPEGQMTWGVHITLAPTWFDPAETLGIITPFMVMYAMHDALVKAMPGNPAT